MPQGSVFSPIPPSLYMNNLLFTLSSTNFTLYADETT